MHSLYPYKCIDLTHFETRYTFELVDELVKKQFGSIIAIPAAMLSSKVEEIPAEPGCARAFACLSPLQLWLQLLHPLQWKHLGAPLQAQT